ncbi:hypothetical protein IJ531_03810 [bacterium]|nr:hypothetical protein [bacterium]
MTEAKISNCLLITIILLTATMLVWTINTISTTQTIKTPTAISAFSA